MKNSRSNRLLFILVLLFSTAVSGSPIQYPLIEVQKKYIRMDDGIQLAVTLYFPQSLSPDETFPVLFEYLPYRKDDLFAARDYEIHSYFAHRGYITARVDIRGTGNSEGSLPWKEYSEQEQLDGLAIIQWLSNQAWSNGQVGMFGISWGANSSLQIAMRKAPALKAILVIDASDNLFKDDIRYIDGMIHVDEYTLSMELFNTIVPGPRFVLDEKSLMDRFDRKPWSLTYLKHQKDGPFWDQGSLKVNYNSIKIPVFMIGGFYDGYRDSIPRILEKVKSPVKAIVGPWNHSFPHDAIPGPSIEWRHEAIRWWDYWLKGIDNGIMAEPRLAVYMRDWYKPNLELKTIPGQWRNEEAWPPRNLSTKKLFLSQKQKLTSDLSNADFNRLSYTPSSGIEGGFWWGDLTVDQKNYDAQSLVYDSDPVDNDMLILGIPEVLLHVSANVKQANWFVRLSDVSPEGDVTLITGAGINSSQRHSSRHPTHARPNQKYSLRIPLHFTSWQFHKGHKVRIAISNALWPMIFPSPEAMHASIYFGAGQASYLTLPTIPNTSMSIPSFLDPEPSEPLAGYSSTDSLWPGSWQIDKKESLTTILWQGHSLLKFPWGALDHSEQMTYKIHDRSLYSSVFGQASAKITLKDRELKWLVNLEISANQDNFFYHLTRQLHQNNVIIREKKWEETIPRRHQ